MTNDVKIKEFVRSCQESGGSLLIVVPSDIVKELDLNVNAEVVVSLYRKYRRDEDGSIMCNKEGTPIVTKQWGTFWRSGK